MQKIVVHIARKVSGANWGQRYDNLVVTAGHEFDVPDDADYLTHYLDAHAGVSAAVELALADAVEQLKKDNAHTSTPEPEPRSQPFPQDDGFGEAQGGGRPDAAGRVPGKVEVERVTFAARDGNKLSFYPEINGEIGQYKAGPNVYLNPVNLEILADGGLTEDMLPTDGATIRLPMTYRVVFVVSDKDVTVGNKRYWYRDLRSIAPDNVSDSEQMYGDENFEGFD